jgi:LSD1 subclass zinc finger protein
MLARRMQLLDLSCTNCGAALQRPEGATQVRCQFCGHVFEVAAPAPLPPPPPPQQDVLRVEIVAPGFTPAVRPRGPNLVGCLLPFILFFAIGGFIFYTVTRSVDQATKNMAPSLPFSVPTAAGRAGRILWDTAGGPPQIATIGGRETAFGRFRMENDQLYVAAIDPTKPDIAWRFGPLGTYGEGLRGTQFGLAHDRLIVADFHGAVHSVDPASGKEIASARLTDKVEHLCAPKAGTAVWVGTVDKRGATFDLESGATHEAPRPAGCDDLWYGHAVPKASTHPAPKAPGFTAKTVYVEAGVGVASGYRSPGTAVPMAIGFDPKSSAVTWTVPIASVDPSTVRERSNEHDALVAGRFISTYATTGKKSWQLTALDAHSGARLWEASMPSVIGADLLDAVVASPSHVYVSRVLTLEVYDASTGARIGAVGSVL